MTNKIFDTNDPFIINAPSNNTTSTIIQSNTIGYSQIPQLISNFENGIVSNGSSPLDIALLNFGETNFYASLTKYNEFLTINNISGKINENSYPFLKDRILQSIIITPSEYANFVNDNLYTNDTVNSDFITNPDKVLKLSDDFYGKTFTENTMGGFCSLAPNIFGAIDFFFSDLAAITGAINKIISQIQNFSLSNLIDTLKNKIMSMIDSAIEKVKAKITNFSIASIMGKFETFVNENLVGRALELKEKAQSFFSEFNIQNLKDKINALINYATSLFKNPSLKEIEFLIYRFCSFASEVENLLNSVTNPLNNFIENYKSTYEALSNTSSINTARAVSAGALRYSTNERKSGVAEAQKNATDAGNTLPIEVKEIDGVTSWNDGKGDSRIKFIGNWVTEIGEEGWTRVAVNSRTYVMRVQELMGKQLIILSGLRPKWYNDKLIAMGRHAAPNSLHIKGLALDVTFVGFNNTGMEELVAAALKAGFTGIGRYPGSAGNFVHMDIGPERHWIGT